VPSSVGHEVGSDVIGSKNVGSIEGNIVRGCGCF